jgi:4-amino-4-deoxy-L-arabinose transferase-like glycosyltransferase
MNLTARRFTAGLALIFIIAFSARFALTQRFVGLDAPPDANANSDQIDYDILAHHMVTGQGYAVVPGTPTASRTPGTSLTLAPVYAVFGRSFIAGRIWFCVLSAMTCVLVAWLGTVCFNRAAGLIAGIGLALYPAHAYYAMHFVSETPFGFWMTLALIASVCAFKQRRGGVAMKWTTDALAGACWAMAIYTRPQLLLAVPIAGVLAVTAFAFRDREHLKRFAVQVAVLSLVLSPWVIRNAVVMGKPTMSTITGYGLWGSHNDLTFSDPAHHGGWVKASVLIDADHPLTGSEVQRNDQATRYGIEAIRENASQMPALIVAKLWRLVTPIKDTDNRPVQIAFAGGWLIVAPLLLLGLFLSLKRSPATACMLMLPFLATIASTVVFYGSDRFRDSLAPMLLLFAAVGLQQIYRAVTQQRAASPIASIEIIQQEETRAA